MQLNKGQITEKQETGKENTAKERQRKRGTSEKREQRTQDIEHINQKRYKINFEIKPRKEKREKTAEKR